MGRQHIPLLDASRISKRYGSKQILDQVSLTLDKGNSLAIVGGSGSGKSTLIRVLLGVAPYQAGTLTYSGQTVQGRRSLGYQALRRETGLVFQNPFNSLDPHWTALQSISEPLRIQRKRLALDDREIERRALNALEAVGLNSQEFADRHPQQCSGGQAQRIAIARGIVTEPTLLVADEPMSSLDVSSRLEILDTFTKLRRSNPSMSMIVVSHDLGVVQHMADCIVVLHNGKIQEEGTTQQILNHPSSAYTQTLLDAAKD